MINKTLRKLYNDGEITKEFYAQQQRKIRDIKLSTTDKYLLSDYPINKEQKDRVIKYRQMLRDLPTQKNFPDVDIPDFSL